MTHGKGLSQPGGTPRASGGGGPAGDGRATRSRHPAWNLSAAVAGLIAVIVAYSGPMAVIVQAARAAELPSGALESWVWAVSLGSGLVGVLLSIALRMPVVAAWSTPGAALLVAALDRYSFAEAVGAYVVAAALTLVVAATGLFDALVRAIPASIGAAMLAGILLEFGIDLFRAAQADLTMVAGMLAGYVCCRRLAPRWSIAVALLIGCACAVLTGRFHWDAIHLGLVRPQITVPAFSLDAVVGLAVPLFLVTMASQNAPGLAVLRAAGYRPDAGRLVLATGAASALLAPFGCHAINLGAITAAICTGPEADEQPERRYIAGVYCGFFYLLVGLFGTAVVGLFTALPDALVSAVVGTALLGALGGAIASATQTAADRDGALVTMLLTASGVEFLGIGSAFWGLVAGTAVHLIIVRARSVPLRKDRTG
ncbi:benzoate/H(+) symporter BenE family transporter [Streptomyces sp. Go-475]|uniref:benzoate/H(+) symporter BenE family transporter n=1 Tax=Streptomyces sp. Go-475 TaxID=2072505 RepID=UPI000DEF8DAA|nr:benzoate/H(+) symporter BenE family transporter [Streptomyces sp. Go-475]AXE88762.1 Inner membrane protein YdcO [Streptomyces sp. Go-475]